MKLFAGSPTRLILPHAVPAGALTRLMAEHPVSSAFVAENHGRFRAADSAQSAPVVATTRSGWTLPGRRSQAITLTGACWVGSNVVPVALEDQGIELVATHLAESTVKRSSFFGPQREVLGLWRWLAPHWDQPFAVREEQPLMTATEPSRCEPHPEVRVAQPQELAQVLPASAAMFTEEVGYAPYVAKDSPYVIRMINLLRQTRTYVVIRNGAVVFKADIGAAAGEVCQIQGVWVDPEFRGQGLSAPCMTAVVEQVRRRWPVVSLYVNSYNIPALKSYHRAGFRQVGTFATVLF
ncbi:GNAT family N-acetyltransferase [Kocuria sp.]|uniref:GNAT family N-acetyltransferase n=1 Tax=Kocuria sp. TaxID=1871328 RepID=UPI0026DF90CD|nr:DUF4081 domain-containing GNAT family N-acetyltransferase [Kocuria sp.]MDO5618781.1 GNAT family N-acetyltransferase [Kocuria sp.]